MKNPGRPKLYKDEEIVRVSFLMTKDIYNKTMEISRVNGITKSQFFRSIIEKEVDDYQDGFRGTKESRLKQN